MVDLSEKALELFKNIYAEKDTDGNPVEHIEDAIARIANVASSVESENISSSIFTQFYDIINNSYFIPATPIWANIGKKDTLWQPGSCFVLKIDDSLDGMYSTLKDTALIFKSGGGVGYNFSSIRPKGSLVNSTKGKSSGVCELIKLYNASSEMVVQGGIRKGASIGILNIDHPEIIDFIKLKTRENISNFNLSVGITKDFIDCVKRDSDWLLSFNGYEESNKVVKARYLMELIVDCAYSCGDPGVIFLDNIQADNKINGTIINAVNPCGELPLFADESCLLGSLNLRKFVKFDKYSNKTTVDFELLGYVIPIAVRFLDNIIDIAEYPISRIKEQTLRTRKIGLGFTGLADLLIMLDKAYDSEEGRSLATIITRFIRNRAIEASNSLAVEKGAYPAWVMSKDYDKNMVRNANLMAIAPTGSVSVMAGSEGYGIEPIFSLAYTKKTKSIGNIKVLSKLFLDKVKYLNLSEDILDEIKKTGSCQHIKEIPASIKKIFKGANEISYMDHLLMQASVQKYVDGGVSKTVNLPENISKSKIKELFVESQHLGIKGLTVFRDKSTDGVIKIGRSKTNDEQPLGRGVVLKRPDVTNGMTSKLETGCGKLYLTINVDPGTNKIVETFITTGSNGGCLSYTEATSRLISLAIRGGIPLSEIVEQLKSTHPCPSYVLAKGTRKDIAKGKSCASAVAIKLEEYIKNGYKENTNSKAVCPLCGESMKTLEGCWTCISCGYSKC